MQAVNCIKYFSQAGIVVTTLYEGGGEVGQMVAVAALGGKKTGGSPQIRQSVFLKLHPASKIF